MTSYSLTISVIIITRNRAKSLKDTLASLAIQTRFPDEVVVVDNASTDTTREVVASFSKQLNIKYVYEPQKGIPYARNAALRNATGNIIASLDDDCIADQDWLSNLEIPFIRDPGIGAVGGEVSFIKMGNSELENFYIKNMVSRGRKTSNDNPDTI